MWTTLIVTSVLAVGIIIGAMVWSVVLERRYTGPYTLLATSPRRKWKRAAILAFLQTLMFPTLGWYVGLYFLQLSTSAEGISWLILPLGCSGIWLFLLPLAVLIKRWGMERALKRYRRASELIRKAGGGSVVFSSGFMRWTRRFLTPEQKRFFEEGYP